MICYKDFIFLSLIFSCYYCSVDLKRQSENSGLRLDMSGLVTIIIVVPTFEERGTFMLGVVFLFSQFSAIEIILFKNYFINPIEDIDSLNSNLNFFQQIIYL